jgi:RNA polymerase sigma factor for flagellar operon FliA
MYQHRVGGLKLRGKRVERPVQAVSINGNHKKAEWTIDPAFAGKDADQLVRDFLPIVRRIATELVLRNPAALDAEDLTSAGVMGLLSAMTRYDPSREIKFRTFAEYRIRGAMLDEIRAMDWVPRSVRARIEKFQQVSAEFVRTVGRPPTQDEIAEMLGIPPEDIGASLMKEATVLSLDEWVGDEDEACTLKDMLPAINQMDPLAACISNQVGDVLQTAIARLPQRQQSVIRQYYFSGMTMRAIGETQGLTESGICRVHADALNRLREELLTIGADIQDAPNP